MNSQTRKAEDNLITIGNGVMLFGAWNFLKFVLSFFIFGADVDESQSFAVKTIVIVVLWIASMIDAGIRVYIGYAARCEGLRRKKLPYLILTGILLFFYIIVVILEIVFLVSTMEEVVYSFIVLLIDITSAVFLLQLLMNSITIRKLRKQYAENGEQYEC